MPQSTRFADFARDESIVRTVAALWRREPALVACGIAAFVLALVCAVTAALRGGWSVPPEGRLLDAFKFEVGVGIYFLTLALLLPLSGMSERGRRRWLAWTEVVAAYFITVETVQALRGLDPRFTEAGGVADQVAGVIFGVSAFGILVLFVILARGFFRAGTLKDHPSLRLAIRYGIAGMALAFGSGVVMSILQTRVIAETGSLMPMHAAGFHGVQAVPLVALLVGWSVLAQPTRVRLTHAAGIGWLLLCIGLLWQALAGWPPTAATAANAVAATGGALWAGCLVAAFAARMRRAPARHAADTAAAAMTAGSRHGPLRQ